MTKALAQQPKQASELSNDLAVITAEINAYKRVAGEAIFEIGRRLKDVRDNPQNYGLDGYRDWERWCRDECDLSRRTANRFIQAFEQLGTTSSQLNVGQIFEIIQLPETVDKIVFLESTHEIPSTGEVKKPEDMTVRELREVKKALKEREQALREAEEARKRAESEASALRDRLEAEPTVRVVENPDTLEKLKRYEAVYGDIDGGDGIYRIDNATEVNGAALEFSTDVRGLLQKYAHLTMYSAEFSAMNKASAREYQSAVDSLKEFINAIERNMPRSNEESVIIDVH